MNKIFLYTETNKMDQKIFEEIWGLLNLPIFNAEVYDSSEPLKNKYDITNSEKGYQLLEEELIIKGNDKNYLSAERVLNGLTLWIFDLSNNKESLIINLIKRINTVLPIVYGFVCSEEEFDKKHKAMDEYSYGWEGISIWDFQDFLPGIYWLNIFGKELSEVIDKEKINDLPNIKVANLDHGTILFHLDKPIIPESLDTRIEQEREIRRILGEQYFFDLEYQDEIEFKHPEKFKEYLVQLEKDY